MYKIKCAKEDIMANKEFSKAIKRIRSNNKFTMQEIADQLGVTKGAVSMWENKGVVPRDDILLKISKLYSISIDDLLGNRVEDEIETVNKKLSYIQRGLEQLDDQQIQKAEKMLKVVFDDIFNDDEGEDDDL